MLLCLIKQLFEMRYLSNMDGSVNWESSILGFCFTFLAIFPFVYEDVSSLLVNTFTFKLRTICTLPNCIRVMLK